jgi:nicotinamide-nucleotide amidase
MLSPSDLELTQLAATLGARLRSTQRRLATAESCTGGWVAKVCTDLAGSSSWFECGFVTYSNEAKQRDLEVSAETLRKDGAVSQATVIAMARGALKRARAQVAIAISGIAGPGGGTPDKQSGTVWFAVATEMNERIGVIARVRRFDGDRDDVRRESVRYAFQLATEFIQ